MGYRDELVALLSSKENIDATLEIVGAIHEMRLTLQKKFWLAARDQLSEVLKRENLHGDWIAEVSGDPFNKPAVDYGGLECVLRKPATATRRLRVGVWREGYRLFVGVGYATGRPDHLPKEVEDLAKVLRETEKFKTPAGVIARRAIEPAVDLLRKYGFEIRAADAALASS